MPSGHALDIVDVHRALWARRDRRNAVRVQQTEVARELGVNKYTMSRKFAQLLEEGRIRQVGSRKNASGMYVVEDPDNFMASSAGVTSVRDSDSESPAVED